MFNRKQIDLRMIDPSSKMSLKMSCVAACKGDLKRAKEMYDYFADGMELPDFPTPRPTAVQQITQQADALFGWIDQNADKFMKGYNVVQMLRGGTPATATEIPPLPPLNNATL